MRCFRLTNVPVKKIQALHILMYRLNYPACKAHAPYYTAICVLSGYTIFSKLSPKRHDFLEKLWSIKCVCFDLLYNISVKYFSLQ